MSESNYWARIKPMLIGLDAQRIESLTGLGVPDVNYTHGWIELKWIKEWPKRPTTNVRIDHFTPQQKVWLIRRIHSGGRAHVLLGIGTGESLLFWGDVAASHIGSSTREELIQHACGYWQKGDRNMPKELKSVLHEDRFERQRGLFDAR
jgi:hypothetical protein